MGAPELVVTLIDISMPTSKAPRACSGACQSTVMRAARPSQCANIRLSARKSPWQRVLGGLAMSVIIGSMAEAIRSPTRCRFRRGPRGDEFLERGPGGAVTRASSDPEPGTEGLDGRFQRHQFRPVPPVRVQGDDLVQRQPRLLQGQSGDLVAVHHGGKVFHHEHEPVGLWIELRDVSLRNAQGYRPGDVPIEQHLAPVRGPAAGDLPDFRGW